ncbi:hypothetical protein Sbal625DRAFT_0293 [Shewanella baltica OS625]|nr:hypothetical protein Sbal678_3777 [Shewanella baltica OS678]EHC07961.1 hypothetical protein Sbal625DRAFT_0293 [Shewanella baltica OS625]
MALTVTGGAIFIWLNSSILSDECEPMRKMNKS